MANFGDRAVLVVGQRVDQHRHAAGTVTLIGHFLVRLAGYVAGALLDGALYGVVRHVGALGRGYRGA